MDCRTWQHHIKSCKVDSEWKILHFYSHVFDLEAKTENYTNVELTILEGEVGAMGGQGVNIIKGSYVNVWKWHNEVIYFLEFILGLCNTLHWDEKNEYWISYFRINYVCYLPHSASLHISLMPPCLSQGYDSLSLVLPQMCLLPPWVIAIRKNTISLQLHLLGTSLVKHGPN